MRLVVIGATGGTGQELVRQGLRAGYQVTAIVRRPDAMTATAPGLTVTEGDVLDPNWAGEGIEDADAVLSALGSRPAKPDTTVYSAGIAAVLAAMQRHDVERIVAISAAPLAPPSQRSGFERRLVHPMLYRFFGGGYRDMARMENILVESDLDWTVFRPPRLTDKQEKGRYRTAVDRRLPTAFSITRADLAAAMLAALDDPSLSRRAVAVAS